MKEINFNYRGIPNNIPFIVHVILETMKSIPSSFIYLGDIHSYSRYEGEDRNSIIERQKLIDFNADTNFRHFREININDFLSYLHKCRHIENCRIIITDQLYTVEELYSHLDSCYNIILDLELFEGDLYNVRFSEVIPMDLLLESYIK